MVTQRVAGQSLVCGCNSGSVRGTTKRPASTRLAICSLLLPFPLNIPTYSSALDLPAGFGDFEERAAPDASRSRPASSASLIFPPGLWSLKKGLLQTRVAPQTVWLGGEPRSCASRSVARIVVTSFWSFPLNTACIGCRKRSREHTQVGGAQPCVGGSRWRRA